MKRFTFILLTLAASLVCGCRQFDEDIEYTPDDSNSNIDSVGNVEVLEDGRLRVTTSLERLGMTSVESRAGSDYENAIYNGWCLVFGATDENSTNYTKDGYGDDSPLIQIVPIVANANGSFYMTFEPFDDKSFIRIVANLTARENLLFGDVTSWKVLAPMLDMDPDHTPDRATVKKYETDSDGNYFLGTFGQYRHQSVGLDGIYNIDYKTSANLTYYPEGHKDYDEETTYWNIEYKTNNSSNIGKNYITGADETYNEIAPNPEGDLNTTTGFPMSSYGFALPNLSEASLKETFGTKIYMVRVCSKVVVDASECSGFDLQEVHLINAAQEARIRSTAMSEYRYDEDGDLTSKPTHFNIPVNLGGTISYEAMSVSGSVSDPIYFYPNSGKDYTYTEAANQAITPQYIIFKGQAEGYDTPGYYKVALKAQYPNQLNADPNNPAHWSKLTYNILRNTSFTVKVKNADRPGYKTLEDAADKNNPANNISYSIEIESSGNRYEILVSNGTYYAELETSRVYVKGYMAEGLKGCYLDFTIYPTQIPKDDSETSDESEEYKNYTPPVYVQTSDHNGVSTGDDATEDVAVTHCMVMREGDACYASRDWANATRVGLTPNDTEDGLNDELVRIDESTKATKVRVFYDVKNSGRIRLRIGDILKYIPVTYDPAPISYKGTNGQPLMVEDKVNGVSWDNFSYEKVVYDEDHTNAVAGFELNSNGTVSYDNTDHFNIKPELRARIVPKEAGDGLMVLYLRQASDFRLINSKGEEYKEYPESYSVDFTAQGRVWKNDTDGLFVGEKESDKVVFDTRKVGSDSVDPLTISIDTKATGESIKDDQFFLESLDKTKQELTLYIDKMDYSNKAYGSLAEIGDDRITYNYTAESRITVENAAGDSKEYLVRQTQYPPIYIVVPSLGVEKVFKMCGKPNNRSENEVCVYAINIYGDGYDDGVDGCGVVGYWDMTDDGDDIDFNYLKGIMYESALNADYLGKYATDKDVYKQSYKDYWIDVLKNYKYKVRRISGEYGELSTLSELDKQSVDYGADACYVLIRNTDKMDGDGWYYYSGLRRHYYADVYVTIYITVTDIYGEQYTTTKEIVAVD